MFTCIRLGEDTTRPAALVLGLSHRELRDIIMGDIHRIELSDSFSIKILPLAELIADDAVPRDAELILFTGKTEEDCATKFAMALPESAREEFLDSFTQSTRRVMSRTDGGEE
jgi:hypothetical protein